MRRKTDAHRAYVRGEVSPSVFAFYSWAFWACPSNGKWETTIPNLSAQSGQSERSVRRHLARLVSADLIEMEAVAGKGVRLWFPKSGTTPAKSGTTPAKSGRATPVKSGRGETGKPQQNQPLPSNVPSRVRVQSFTERASDRPIVGALSRSTGTECALQGWDHTAPQEKIEEFLGEMRRLFPSVATEEPRGLTPSDVAGTREKTSLSEEEIEAIRTSNTALISRYGIGGAIRRMSPIAREVYYLGKDGKSESD